MFLKAFSSFLMKLTKAEIMVGHGNSSSVSLLNLGGGWLAAVIGGGTNMTGGTTTPHIKRGRSFQKSGAFWQRLLLSQGKMHRDRYCQDMVGRRAEETLVV